MSRIFKAFIAAGLISMSLTACASAPQTEDVDLGSLGLFGETPNDIDQRLEKAAAFPLGSQENPVRVYMPDGERAYLRRLRCLNGQAPVFERIGSYGMGVFGHIIDGYDVKCVGSEPAQSVIYMDMYFAQHVETKAPPGFTLVD